MPFFVQVITTKRNDPDHIIDTRKINYDKTKAREWLAKHSYWALRHGYAVHTARADELPTLDQVVRATVTVVGEVEGDQLRAICT